MSSGKSSTDSATPKLKLPTAAPKVRSPRKHPLEDFALETWAEFQRHKEEREWERVAHGDPPTPVLPADFVSPCGGPVPSVRHGFGQRPSCVQGCHDLVRASAQGSGPSCRQGVLWDATRRCPRGDTVRQRLDHRLQSCR